MGGKENDGSRSRRPPTRYTTCPQQGTRLQQTRSTSHGRKGKDKVYALRPRNTCLAGRGKSSHPLSHIKTSSQKIQPLSHQESSIRRFLQARTSGTVENPPGDPC